MKYDYEIMMQKLSSNHHDENPFVSTVWLKQHVKCAPNQSDDWLIYLIMKVLCIMNWYVPKRLLQQ
jgi:hypothetical protein